ncbi:MAG TPA: hypothetical protein VJ865_14725 [Gemmatimonadaceae bacterium]|nr:hypothetical protein [Gemmatimonadaceae bacterium]
MTLLLFQYVLPAAYDVLPPEMQSDEASAMLMAIALQESECSHRRQQPHGPARGFWQFEAHGGVVGVLRHPITGPLARRALVALCYSTSLTARDIHALIEHNDTVAAVWARLLLWTVRGALPGPENPNEGWRQYLSGWRPGRPRPATWNGNFTRAWALIDTGEDT